MAEVNLAGAGKWRRPEPPAFARLRSHQMYLRTHVTAFRRALVAGAIVVAIVLLSRATAGVRAQAPDPCAPPNGNPVACENQQAGAPASEWDINGAGDATI